MYKVEMMKQQIQKINNCKFNQYVYEFPIPNSWQKQKKEEEKKNVC